MNDNTIQINHIIIILFSYSAYSETIESEITTYQENTQYNKIIGGRQMILDKIEIGDIKKARDGSILMEIGTYLIPRDFLIQIFVSKPGRYKE